MKKMNEFLFRKSPFPFGNILRRRRCSALQLFDKSKMFSSSLYAVNQRQTLFRKINRFLPNFQILKREPLITHVIQASAIPSNLNTKSHQPSAKRQELSAKS